MARGWGNALALAALVSLPSCRSEHPPPPSRAPEVATAPPPAEPATPDLAPQVAPARAPGEPDPAQADPLRRRIASEPNDAQARCQLGWLYFEAGEPEVADAEIARGIETLENDFRIGDGRGRQTLGACLHDRGRVRESRGENEAALFDYERSLWYRENAAVRERWTALAQTIGRTGARPQSVPPSLWLFATAREAEECGPPPERGGRVFGEDSTRGSCAVHIEALARGTDHRVAAVLSVRDYDDAGTPEQAWDDTGTTRYELATSDGTTWTRREDVYVTDATEGESDVSFTMRYQDASPGGEPEILIEVDDHWEQELEDEEDAEHSSGREGRLLVCGDPDGETAYLCASIVSRHEVTTEGEDPEQVVESVEVRFMRDGRVTIRGRLDGERVRRDTTVADLWTVELAARAATAAHAAAAATSARQASAPTPAPILAP
jgi:hypothetical protein